MAGVVGSNPTRPTILSLTHVGSSKLLGPLQLFAAALQLFNSLFNSRSFFFNLQRIYRCCTFVNCLEPFKNCCSVGLRKKEGQTKVVVGG
jgi:hypothetical protein